jgi:hypothetical protein
MPTIQVAAVRLLHLYLSQLCYLQTMSLRIGIMMQCAQTLSAQFMAPVKTASLKGDLEAALIS